MNYPNIEVIAEVDLPPQVNIETLANWLDTTLAFLQVPRNSGLTCVISNDEHIQLLNRDYRSTDEPTDVLSFSAKEGTEFVVPEELPPYLGDIIISLPTAERQAAEASHSIEKELALLAVHGCLHLLGYEHADEDTKARMWQVQEQILQKLEEAN